MTTNSEPIYSSLASDLEYADLVKDFVNAFASKTETIHQCVSEKNLMLLQRTLHQMRGACGSYGFPTLSKSAAKVEERLQAGGSLESVEESISEFLNLLARASAEKPY